MDCPLRDNGLCRTPCRDAGHLALQLHRNLPSYPNFLLLPHCPRESRLTPRLPLQETIVAARHGSTLYTIQLGLNLAWMPLFYGLNRPILATLDAFALLGINGYLAWLWGTKVDRVSGWLMAPYVAWLGFATYLSYGTGYLNNWDLSPLFGGRGHAGGSAEAKKKL